MRVFFPSFMHTKTMSAGFSSTMSIFLAMVCYFLDNSENGCVKRDAKKKKTQLPRTSPQDFNPLKIGEACNLQPCHKQTTIKCYSSSCWFLGIRFQTWF